MLIFLLDVGKCVPFVNKDQQLDWTKFRDRWMITSLSVLTFRKAKSFFQFVFVFCREDDAGDWDDVVTENSNYLDDLS